MIDSGYTYIIYILGVYLISRVDDWDPNNYSLDKYEQNVETILYVLCFIHLGFLKH